MVSIAARFNMRKKSIDTFMILTILRYEKTYTLLSRTNKTIIVPSFFYDCLTQCPNPDQRRF